MQCRAAPQIIMVNLSQPGKCGKAAIPIIVLLLNLAQNPRPLIASYVHCLSNLSSHPNFSQCGFVIQQPWVSDYDSRGWIPLVVFWKKRWFTSLTFLKETSVVSSDLLVKGLQGDPCIKSGREDGGCVTKWNMPVAVFINEALETRDLQHLESLVNSENNFAQSIL